MSILEYIRKLKQSVSDLTQNREKDCQIISRDALALIRLRIQNDGVGSDGQSFGGYSQAVVPVWFFRGRSRTGGTAAYNRLKKKGYFVSYKDHREANNLQTGHIDLKFTGDMWRDIKPRVVESGSFAVKVSIDANKETDKLKYNSDRYGNILRLSAGELAQVRAANKKRVLKALKQIR